MRFASLPALLLSRWADRGVCVWPDVIARRSGRLTEGGRSRQRTSSEGALAFAAHFSKFQTSTTYLRRRVIRGCLGIWPPCCPLAGGLDGFDSHGRLACPHAQFMKSATNGRSYLLPSISSCVFNLQGRAEGVRVRVAATASETDVVACELVARELRHAPLTGQEPGPFLMSQLDASY